MKRAEFYLNRLLKYRHRTDFERVNVLAPVIKFSFALIKFKFTVDVQRNQLPSLETKAEMKLHPFTSNVVCFWSRNTILFLWKSLFVSFVLCMDDGRKKSYGINYTKFSVSPAKSAYIFHFVLCLSISSFSYSLFNNAEINGTKDMKVSCINYIQFGFKRGDRLKQWINN